MCTCIWQMIGWTFDILQRIITFFLACLMCCAILTALFVAVGAGIAYGYNTSLAEFLETSSNDITVYVRRGQFGDQPEIKSISRRSEGDDTIDLFSSNDARDNKVEKFMDDTKPLTDAWQKAQDSRTYAEKLTKYSKVKKPTLRIFPNAGQVDNENLVTVTKLPHIVHAEETPLYDALVASSVIPLLPSRKSLENSDPERTDNVESDINLTINDRQHELKKHRHKGQKKPDIKIEIDDQNSLNIVPLSKTTKEPWSRFFENENYSDGDKIV